MSRSDSYRFDENISIVQMDLNADDQLRAETRSFPPVVFTVKMGERAAYHTPVIFKKSQGKEGRKIKYAK